MANRTGVVAFSGGLDTSFLVPFSREKYGLDRVVTCTVNTGGFGKEDKERIERRAKEVGADEHLYIEAEEEFYSSIIKYMVFGNVTRDGYPMCVGAERLIQAKEALKVCDKFNAEFFLHGSTGAGNDQYRFDLVAHVLGRPGLKTIAPVREFGFSREYSTNYLKERGIDVPAKNTNYSYNVGLWGVSIGGKETHSSLELIPEEVWHSHPEAGVKDGELELEFKAGEPVGLKSPWGAAKTPVEIIKLATEIGNRFGIGRHYHIGTSVPGKKGRLAYESPAADIIYAGHHTLEKITLTQAQVSGKVSVAQEFGRLVHEAKFFDPYIEDLAAYLTNSQKRVTGTAKVYLTAGQIKAVTCDSPFNLLAAKGATYGEVSEFYDGRDAEGACKLNAFEQKIYYGLGKK